MVVQAVLTTLNRDRGCLGRTCRHHRSARLTHRHGRSARREPACCPGRAERGFLKPRGRPPPPLPGLKARLPSQQAIFLQRLLAPTPPRLPHPSRQERKRGRAGSLHKGGTGVLCPLGWVLSGLSSQASGSGAGTRKEPHVIGRQQTQLWGRLLL